MMKKVNVIGKFYFKEELARNSAVMIASSAIAGASDYLYIVKRRSPDTRKQGILGALSTISYMLMVISWVQGTSASRIWRMA